MKKWAGVLVSAVVLVALAALPAGAGDGAAAPLHIRKVVVGPVPAGTQFVVTVTCDPPTITPGGVSSQQFVFDAQGNPVGTGDTVTFEGPTSCTVTETQTGGAASVTYECEGTLPPPNDLGGSGRFSARLGIPQGPICPSSGPQSDPITVNIIASRQEATVTVTNTFVPAPAPPTPEPAVAVEEAPSFTG